MAEPIDPSVRERDRERDREHEHVRARLAAARDLPPAFLRAFASKLGSLSHAVGEALVTETETVRAVVAARQAWREEHGGRAWPCRAHTVRERLAEVHAPGVDLAFDPRKGRILRATRPFAEGEVLVVEDPLVSAEGPPAAGPATGAAPSEDARVAGAFGSSYVPLRMAERLLAGPPERLAVALDLADAHQARHADWARVVEQARAGGLAVGAGAPALEVARLICIVRTNAHAGPDGSTLLLPVIAMAAHSCATNTRVVSEGGLTFLHARRAIDAGEEITAAYVGTDLPTPERVLQLGWRYGFWCRCPRCIEVAPEDIERTLDLLPPPSGADADDRAAFVARVRRLIEHGRAWSEVRDEEA